jgi:MFS family permease
MSRDVVLLLTSLMLASIPVGYLQVVLPLYLNRAGLEPALIGILYSVSGLVTAVLVAFSGVLADRFGRRHFMICGTALPIVSYAIFAWSTNPTWLLLASFVGGVGLASGAAGAMTAASFDALLAEHTPPARRTTVFAWSQALWSVALAAGALAAGLPELLRTLQPDLGALDAYRPPFILIMGLAAAATIVLLPLRELHGDRAPLERKRGSWLPRRSMGVIVRYSVALGMFGLGLGIAVQLLPLWLSLRFGVDEAAMGPWYGAAQLLSLTSVLTSPLLERSLGTALGVMIVHLLGSMCLFAIAFLAPTFEIAAVAVMARTVLANIAWPLQQALLMDRAAPEERASAAGVGFSVWGVTNAVGPVVGGALMQAGALVLPIFLGGVAYALGGIAFGVGFGASVGFVALGRGVGLGKAVTSSVDGNGRDSELRLVSDGSGVVGQDGDRDRRESGYRQGDRPGAGD